MSIRAGERTVFHLSAWRRAVWSPWAPAAIVALVYGLWLAIALARHDPRDYIQLGRRFVDKSHVSSTITVDPRFRGYVPGGIGYDGEFYYFLAVDPVHARYYMDDPAYRYTRILYPMTARLLALGRADAIPYTLLIVNWCALWLGTLALAAWLARKGVLPWFALVFGFYPGLFLAFRGDLTEPLSYALVAGAMYLSLTAIRHRTLWVGVLFGLAVLARESSAVFPAVLCLALLFRRRWRDAALLAVIAFLPFAVYKAFLVAWLGAGGTPAFLYPTRIPFQGIAEQVRHGLNRWEVITVVFPGLLSAGAGIWALWRGARRVEIALLLVNVLLFVVLLPAASWATYSAAGRITAGVVLAAILCIPVVDASTRGNRIWFVAAGFLWMLGWHAVPTAFLQ